MISHHSGRANHGAGVIGLRLPRLWWRDGCRSALAQGPGKPSVMRRGRYLTRMCVIQEVHIAGESRHKAVGSRWSSTSVESISPSVTAATHSQARR